MIRNSIPTPELPKDRFAKEQSKWTTVDGIGTHLVASCEKLRHAIFTPVPYGSNVTISYTLTGRQATIVIQIDTISQLIVNTFGNRNEVYIKSVFVASAFLIQEGKETQCWSSHPSMDGRLQTGSQFRVDFGETWTLDHSIPQIDNDFDKHRFLDRECFAEHIASGVDLITSEIDKMYPAFLKHYESKVTPVVVDIRTIL